MAAKVIDLTGMKFGTLTVIARSASYNGQSQWLVRCECGQENIVFGCRLRYGHTVRCDKESHRKSGKDLTGMRFGKLLVQSRSVNKSKSVSWVCVCDCGDTDIIPDWRLLSMTQPVLHCRNKAHNYGSHIVDLTGRRFDSWIVVSRAPNPMGRPERNAFWFCRCDCGLERVIMGVSLKGKTKSRKSCGCLRSINHGRY